MASVVMAESRVMDCFLGYCWVPTLIILCQAAGRSNIQDLPRPVSLSAFDDLLIWGTVRLTRRAGAVSIVQEAAWAHSGLGALELHHAASGLLSSPRLVVGVDCLT